MILVGPLVILTLKVDHKQFEAENDELVNGKEDFKKRTILQPIGKRINSCRYRSHPQSELVQVQCYGMLIFKGV